MQEVLRAEQTMEKRIGFPAKNLINVKICAPGFISSDITRNLKSVSGQEKFNR